MKNKEIIHVYLMPGMAASSKIFEFIKLPENEFKIHLLEWITPLEKESINAYAFRISKVIKHENIVLLGVSFGGVLVQEISKYVTVKKLIIVSSIKTMKELPKTMVMAKKTRVYKLIPTKLAKNISSLSKYVSSRRVVRRLDLYDKYLSVNDERYLDWAIKNMVTWNQQSYNPNIIHIHGDNDAVFPIKNISNCLTIKNGTHIMIIDKYKWFNQNLPKIILEN